MSRDDILVIRSGDPDYPKALGLVANGVVRVLGERYDKNGAHVMAVMASGAKPNAEKGFIRIGEEYFTLALKDYEDWQEKWWREALQNAVDAGATNVTCMVVLRPDGNYDVSCEDDAGGMDLDTIVNKFLVLGGTTKKIGSTTGGFGKAKELLILPWISWSMETRNVRVEGAGGAYETSDVPTRVGTKIGVVMPADNATSGAAAAAFIGKCWLPHVHFEVNGEIVKANLKVGEPLRSFEGKAELSQNKRSTFQQLMVIRANGLYMFHRSIPREVPGTIIVELLRPSIELLTANRDGFRDRHLGYQIDDFANELAADVHSALQKKKGLIRDRFQGTGKFKGADKDQVAEAMARVLAEAISKAKAGKTVTLKFGEVEGIALDLNRLVGEGADVPETSDQGINLRTDGGIAEAMLTGLDVRGPNHVQNIAKQLAWEPDFFIINDVEGFRVASKFKPAGMTPTLAKLARYWAELCKFVLVQVGSDAEYGVGWVFNSSMTACYTLEQGENWLLLNPFKGSIENEELYSLTSDEDLNYLYAVAVHEVTHLADHVSYHNESFSSAMTKNVARCAGKEAQIKKIRKAVTARKPKASHGVAPSSSDGLREDEQAIIAAMVAVGAVGRVSKSLDERAVLEHLSREHSSSWTMQHVRDTLLNLEKQSPTLAVETELGRWIVTDEAKKLVKPSAKSHVLFWDQALALSVLENIDGGSGVKTSDVSSKINRLAVDVDRDFVDLDRTRDVLERLAEKGLVQQREDYSWSIADAGRSALRDLMRYLPADHGRDLTDTEKEIMATFINLILRGANDVYTDVVRNDRYALEQDVVEYLAVLRGRGWVEDTSSGSWRATKDGVQAFAAYMVTL